MNISDNYDLWTKHEVEQEEKLQELPVCSDCDEHIQQEDAVYINGEWLCDSCLSSYRREVVPEW